MHANELIFKELIKRGYSSKGKKRVWDLSDSKLWYLTPELSKGFLKLYKYEPYRKAVVETEIRLLKENCSKIIEKFENKRFNLVDLGSGNGMKTSEFIKGLKGDVRIKYVPIDISEYFIENAKKRVKSSGKKKVVTVKPFISEFDDFGDIIDMMRDSKFKDSLILLLGETLSHYDINEFLYDLSSSMKRNDMIVIGNGYREGLRFVDVEKYKNELFNEWFVHILLSLGFEKDELKYSARFANGRLEGYYTILNDKKFNFKGKNIYFRKGDEVVVAIQYKFYQRELIKFAKMYFKDVEFIGDKKREYCLLVCRK